jgi:hypothetical protein
MKTRALLHQLASKCLILSACLAGSSLLAQSTNLVTLSTFQSPDGQLRYTYPYHYTYGGADPGGSAEQFNASYFDPNDAELTNAMGAFTFDDSVFAGFLAANPGGGFGYGFGGGLNFDGDATRFTSTNREDYIVSFDMKVEGLAPGSTTADGEFQIRFDAPDDTIQPPDDNFDIDTLLQVNIPVHPSTNWTHYVFTLDQGSIGGGSEENFALYNSLISDPRFGVNFNNPEAFGYDADNAIYIDNIRLDVVQNVVTSTPPPTVDIPIVDWNFDDKPAAYDYAYTYSQNNAADFTAQAGFLPEGIGGSNANVLTFDSATFTNGTPSYAGAGSGFSGNMSQGQFTTTNLASYRLDFDYRVEGLDPAKSGTPGQMQLAIRTNGNAVITINFDVTLKTNWQTFSGTLKKGSVGGGSLAALSQNLAAIDSIQPNFQVSAVPGDFGADADNKIVIDNVRLVRLEVGLPPLTISRNGNSTVITWSGAAKLQSATSITGPWSDVTGATSPYTVPPSSGDIRFYRTSSVQ